MLPFRVIQIEQHRALQQNAVKLLPPNPSLLAGVSPGRNFASPIHTPDLSRRDFASVSSQNLVCLRQKNEWFFAKWSPTSNRQRVKNRCCRKQKTKPRLTTARTHIRLLPNFAKTAQGSDELHY